MWLIRRWQNEDGSRCGDLKASEAKAVPRKRMAAGFLFVSFGYFVCMFPGFVHLCHSVIFPCFHFGFFMFILRVSTYFSLFSLVFLQYVSSFFFSSCLLSLLHVFLCVSCETSVRHRWGRGGADGHQICRRLTRTASRVVPATRKTEHDLPFVISQSPSLRWINMVARVSSQLFTTHHHSARAVWPFPMWEFLLFSAAFVGSVLLSRPSFSAFFCGCCLASFVMCTALLPFIFWVVMLSILSSTVLLSQILSGRCRPPPEILRSKLFDRSCALEPALWCTRSIHSILVHSKQLFDGLSDTSFERSRSRNTPTRHSKSRVLVRAILGHGQALGADADGEGHGCTHVSAEKLHVSHANPRVTAMVGQKVLRLVAFRRT